MCAFLIKRELLRTFGMEALCISYRFSEKKNGLKG